MEFEAYVIGTTIVDGGVQATVFLPFQRVAEEEYKKLSDEQKKDVMQHISQHEYFLRGIRNDVCRISQYIDSTEYPKNDKKDTPNDKHSADDTDSNLANPKDYDRTATPEGMNGFNK